MKNVKTYVGQLTTINRLPSSVNGNPRYSIDITLDNGSEMSFCTPVDSCYADDVKNLDRWGDFPRVKVRAGTHFGKLMIDGIDAIK